VRILQSLYDAGGGVAPQLAVTRLLVERGHEVRVLAHETLREAALERGATFVPFVETLPGHDMRRAESDLVRDWEPEDPAEAGARFRDLVLFGPALTNAREVIGVLQDFPADAIVLDWLLFGTALAAEYAAVPAVALVHLPYPLRISAGPGDEFMAPGLTTMNEARSALGLPPVEEWDRQLLNTDAVLVLCAPELDRAAGAELPHNVHHVGRAVEPSSATWRSPWPDSDRDPLVLVSLSTTFMDQRDLAHRVLRAVDGLPVRVLVTTGPALDLDGLAVPANTRISPHEPHAAVMPHCALVVTHAGWGTVQAALAAGKPMICIPSGRDQPDNAARIEELGVGRALPPDAPSQEIRRAIVEALVDRDLAKTAARTAEVVSRLDGAAAVVDLVESFAGRP
jgi:UDP:flavonoid glycosyltransferase YjiC (YdhE family)